MSFRASITSLLLWMIYMAQTSHSAHFIYTPEGKRSPCIMLDAKFTLKINAVRNKHIVTTDIIHSDNQTINLSGSCDESRAVLNLGFRGGVMWSFIFRNTKNIVSLSRLIEFTPNKIFAKYVTNIPDPVTFDDPATTVLSRSNESYECVSMQSTDYFPIKSVPGDTTFTIHAEISHFRAQAFELKHDRYSPLVICYNDGNKTTTTTTTTKASTITPPLVPSYVFHARNPADSVLCIAMTGRLSIDIRYRLHTTDDVKMGNVTFTVPRDAKSYGNCSLSGETQNLILEFFKPSWTLELVFHKNFGTLGQTQRRLGYDIKSINLVYVINPEMFPNSILPNDTKVRQQSTQEEWYYPHKLVDKGFYSCISKVDWKINKNANLTTSEFKFKAFNNDAVWYFEGNPTTCGADKKIPIKVNPIIGVIIIIAFLVIIGIIFVVIMLCKKRKRRRHYKPIKGRKIY